MESCWIFFSWFCLFVAQLSTGNASRIIRGYHSLLFVIKKKGFTLQYKHLYGSPNPPPPPPPSAHHLVSSIKLTNNISEDSWPKERKQPKYGRYQWETMLVPTNIVYRSSYLTQADTHLKVQKKYKYKFSSIFSFYTLKQIEGENKR